MKLSGYFDSNNTQLKTWNCNLFFAGVQPAEAQSTPVWWKDKYY
jgi:hypothetical protein